MWPLVGQPFKLNYLYESKHKMQSTNDFKVPIDLHTTSRI